MGITVFPTPTSSGGTTAVADPNRTAWGVLAPYPWTNLQYNLCNTLCDCVGNIYNNNNQVGESHVVDMGNNRFAVVHDWEDANLCCIYIGVYCVDTTNHTVHRHSCCHHLVWNCAGCSGNYLNLEVLTSDECDNILMAGRGGTTNCMSGFHYDADTGCFCTNRAEFSQASDLKCLEDAGTCRHHLMYAGTPGHNWYFIQRDCGCMSFTKIKERCCQCGTNYQAFSPQGSQNTKQFFFMPQVTACTVQMIGEGSAGGGECGRVYGMRRDVFNVLTAAANEPNLVCHCGNTNHQCCHNLGCKTSVFLDWNQNYIDCCGFTFFAELPPKGQATAPMGFSGYAQQMACHCVHNAQNSCSGHRQVEIHAGFLGPNFSYCSLGVGRNESVCSSCFSGIFNSAMTCDRDGDLNTTTNENGGYSLQVNGIYRVNSNSGNKNNWYNNKGEVLVALGPSHNCSKSDIERGGAKYIYPYYYTRQMQGGLRACKNKYRAGGVVGTDHYVEVGVNAFSGVSTQCIIVDLYKLEPFACHNCCFI